jgi:hypothetical protein
MPLVVPPSTPAPPQSIAWQWVDRSQVIHDLTYETSPGLFVSRGSLGLGTAGADISDEKNPGTPGSTVRLISTPPTDIELPIMAMQASMDDLLGVLEDLGDWFDTGDETRRTPGYLRVTRPDGTVRQLMCYRRGPIGGDLTKGNPSNTTFVVSLRAPDPWPTAPTQTITIWTAADVASPVSALNDGQLDAYPIWTITGPTTSISVFNNTTGKPWSLVFSLAAGKTVTVDTRPPTVRTDIAIRDSDLVNRYPALYPGSKVFGNWLPSGTNSLTITLAGYNSATRVQLAYLARYRGMLR